MENRDKFLGMALAKELFLYHQRIIWQGKGGRLIRLEIYGGISYKEIFQYDAKDFAYIT